MENPFVGMDPFLEGKNWKELHQNLLGNFQKQLNLELLPRYSAQMDFYIRIDVNPEENQRGLNECSINAGYRYRIDYTKKPPPSILPSEKMPKIP